MDSAEKLDFITMNSSVLHSFEGSGYSSSPKSMYVSAIRPKNRTPIPLNFTEVSMTPGVIRVVCRLQYKKLHRLMRVCTEHMDLRLLSKLAPSAALLVTDRTVTLNLMLRLDGRCWPPLIVYDAGVVGAKKMDLRHGSTGRGRQRKLWRTVITDKLMLGAKSCLPQVKPIRMTSPRGVKHPMKTNRREMFFTYNWKNREEREEEERPDVKYRYLETIIAMKPATTKKSRSKQVDSKYLSYWSSLCSVRLSWKSGLPSNSFLL